VHLEPCPSCLRHVKTTEVACPFCAATLPESLRMRPHPRVPLRQLGRRATFAFGMAVAAGCGGKTERESHVDAGAGDVQPASESTLEAATGQQPGTDAQAPLEPTSDATAGQQPAPDSSTATAVDASNIVDVGGPIPIYSAAPP
jgi:hypothetical protein